MIPIISLETARVPSEIARNVQKKGSVFLLRYYGGMYFYIDKMYFFRKQINHVIKY